VRKHIILFEHDALWAAAPTDLVQSLDTIADRQTCLLFSGAQHS